jgi:hypothetical protein
MKTQYTLKTLFYTVMFLSFFNLNTQAQNGREFYHTPYNTRNSGSFDKGTNLISIGYGFPNYLYNGYNVTNTRLDGRRLGFGPGMLKYEFAIRDEVGLGIVLQGAGKSFRYTAGNTVYTDHAWGVGGAFMGYYHFNKLIPVEKLDVYAGLGINFTYQELNRDAAYYNYYYDYYGYYYTDAVRSDFSVRPNGVLGVRYYVAPKFSFYAEAGYTSFSSLNLGMTFRL